MKGKMKNRVIIGLIIFFILIIIYMNNFSKSKEEITYIDNENLSNESSGEMLSSISGEHVENDEYVEILSGENSDVRYYDLYEDDESLTFYDDARNNDSLYLFK